MTVAKKLLGGKSELAKFFNSVGFIWIIAALTLIFWVTKLDLPGLAALCIIMGAVLFFCEDATPVITCFVFLFFVFSNSEMSFTGRELWCLVLVVPFSGFAYNVIKFKASSFRWGGFSIAVLIALLPWLLQGIGVKNRDGLRVFLCILISTGYVAGYFLMYITSRRKKHTEYMAHVLLAVGVLILVQFIIYHLREGDYLFRDDWTMLGWGTRNPAAAILALVTPVPFWFATRGHKFDFLFLLLGFVDFLVIVLLQSRGVILVAGLALPVLMVYSVVCSKKKAANIVVNCVVIAAVVVIAVVERQILKELLGRVLTAKLDSNGRTELWSAGISGFVEHPIFGVGFDHRADIYYELTRESEGPTYYHSTFIQIFACLGIFGGLAYAYLYYWRYRVAFTDHNPMKFAITVGLIVFEIYCFIDTVYFQPVGYFLPLMISFCMEKDLDGDQVKPLFLSFVERKRRTVDIDT